MKKIVLTIVAALSVASMAHADVSVTGTKAKNIATALAAAGAFTDCGMGKCGTEASDLQCLEQGNSVDAQTYSCTLSVESETGAMKTVSIEGDAAKNLLSAIEDAGVQGDCGMGTCGAEAKSVQVTFENAKEPSDASYEATIQ